MNEAHTHFMVRTRIRTRVRAHLIHKLIHRLRFEYTLKALINLNGFSNKSNYFEAKCIAVMNDLKPS